MVQSFRIKWLCTYRYKIHSILQCVQSKPNEMNSIDLVKAKTEKESAFALGILENL